MSKSTYYQIVVAGNRKIDGDHYVDGDTFPYDPANIVHARLLEQGLLRVETTTANSNTTRSKSKSSRSKSS